MSFKFYEWLILGLVGVGAAWAWIESARGNMLADFAALGLTAVGIVLFVVFAIAALKRGAAEEAVGTFQDGAYFARDLGKDSQMSLIAAMKLGADIQKEYGRIMLQESRNNGHVQKAISQMGQREHSFGINLGQKLGNAMFQMFKDAYNPAEQYADPVAGQGQAPPADDWESMFVDAEHYDQGGR